MGIAGDARIESELEIAANELFPRWIRRVELLEHDDSPMIKPGQVCTLPDGVDVRIAPFAARPSSQTAQLLLELKMAKRLPDAVLSARRHM